MPKSGASEPLQYADLLVISAKPENRLPERERERERERESKARKCTKWTLRVRMAM